MRRTSPIIPAVAILLIAIQALHAQPKRPTTPGSGAVPAAATVNGKTIPLGRYNELLADQRAYQLKLGMTDVVSQATEDQFLLQLIDEELLREEAERRRITVSRQEARDVMIKNPPAFMRDPFLDPKGVFQADAFRQVILHPELIARMVKSGLDPAKVVAQWKNDVEKVISFVQAQELRRRVQDQLQKEKPLTPAMIRARYFTEQTQFTGSFIRVLHSTVADSLVPVSETEARAWYDSHVNDYRFASARQLATIILPVAPTPADSARQRALIAGARERVANAPIADRPRILNDLARTQPPNRFPEAEAVGLRRFPREAQQALRKAHPGDLIGPFNIENEDILLYVQDTASVADTVLHVRHILVPIREQDSALEYDTRTLLDTLRTKITTPEFFQQAVQFYSQDVSKNNGGDLGYLGRGETLPEFEKAAFAAPVGTCVGPVRTKVGYHLIWVDERTTAGYRVRELRYPFSASPEAVAHARNDATTYARALQTRTATDSLFFALRGAYPRTVVDTSIVRRLDTYGDALAAVNFAFNPKTQVGDAAVLAIPYDRIMIAHVLFAYPTGTAPYDKVRQNFVYPHVRRAKQLDYLAPIVKHLRDTITADMTVGIIRMSAPWAESFMIQNQHLTSPPDEDTTILDQYVESTPDNGVAGPVRGTHGWYFLRVLKKTSSPSEAVFQRDRARFTADYTDRYRSQLLDKLLRTARDYAVVEDLRPGATAGDYESGGGGGGSSGGN